MSGTAEARPPHRWRRILLWSAGTVILLPVVLVLAVLAFANTGAGQRLIAQEAGPLSGGLVRIQGLSGRFPDALRVAHLQVADRRGIWLRLDDVALDWSPLALLGGAAKVRLLSAGHIDVARLPAPAPASAAPPSKGGFSLPVQVDLARLSVARIDLAPPVAGFAAAASIAGAAQIASLQQGSAHLAINRLDGPGSYALTASLAPAGIHARLTADEPQQGLIAGLARLPGLTPLHLTVTANGPRTALAAALNLRAGGIAAQATGTVDLASRTAAIDLTATAPAMTPRPDIAWNSIALTARVHGAFAAPDIAAHAVLTGVAGGGARIGRLSVDAGGDRGSVDAHMVLTDLVLPPPQPDIFSAAPLDFTLHADLADPALPLRFTLHHPVVDADGTATLGGQGITARLHTVVSQLTPLAAIGHVDLQGHTEAVATLATHGPDTDVTVDGTADFTGGQAPVPALLGRTTYGVTASLRGQDITITRAVVDGAAAHASVTGTDLAQGLSLAWRLSLSDLAKAAPKLTGAIAAGGTVRGNTGDLALDARVTGDVGAAGVPRGPVTLTVKATGVPANPAGEVTAEGRLAGAPLHLDADLSRQPDGAFHAVIRRAAWKSLTASGDVVLPKGQSFPAGQFTARMTRLADLAPLIGQQIAGSLQARLATTAGAVPVVTINVAGTGIEAPGAAIGRVSLTGHVSDPTKDPDLALVLTADALAASSVSGSARISADGRLAALLVHGTAGLTVSGAPATATVQARVDAKDQRIELTTLDALYKGEALHLRAPARIDLKGGAEVDHLSLGLGQASLLVAGRISPRLDLTAALRNVTPALAKPFVPSLDAAGVLTADARLTGTPAAPQGTARLQASGLRLRTGPAASLAPGTLRATLGLDGHVARVDAQLAAGPRLHLALDGTAPLQQGGALDLHARGHADLAVLNPILEAGGRRAQGAAAIDVSLGGTLAAPRISGGATLTGGEVQDYAQGIRVRAIDAALTAAGDTLRIDHLTGLAGQGTLGVSGSVGVLAPGLPVDLHLTAAKARPLSSDLLTATLDADLTVKGQAQGVLDAAGRIFVRQADINIPNGLPPSVATLHVLRPGQKPPPPAPPSSSVVDLDIVLDAPSAVFVRGHGLDAEMGGKITITGSTAAPQISGGLNLRNGTFSLAGTTLTFTKGDVGFDGTSVTNKIDPTLDFAADNTNGGVTATLHIGGYADKPKITLSSVPDLPQDEILAQLLYGTSVKNLSAVQIAEIGAALAELSGVTGGGGDPLAAVRKGLGLDRLSVGGGSGSGSGATVEAGRYVARGVFVGAKQATSGGGTAAELQVDITKRLKAKAQLATGGGSVQGATPDNDPGSTIGLSYQFDY